MLVGHELLVYFIEVVVVTRDCEDVLFSVRELVGGVRDLSEVLWQVSPLPILLHVLRLSRGELHLPFAVILEAVQFDLSVFR